MRHVRAVRRAKDLEENLMAEITRRRQGQMIQAVFMVLKDCPEAWPQER
jgi:hypothetical protein